MANPNKTFRRISKKNSLSLVVEDIYDDRWVAERAADKLRETNKYYMVKVNKYRFGSKSERKYNYAVRAYKKS